ncbi:MAG: VCBS repeat-containing protein [Planctomycetes bacterium]|nr:VCBS repeat-containing protein [Planctomycetota bacterium]
MPTAIFRSKLSLLGGALLALLGLVGCQGWEAIRKEFIDPFNEFLHQQYPRAYREGNLEKILAFYHPDLASRPEFRQELQELLSRFTRIDRSQAVIEAIELVDGEKTVRAEITFLLCGVTPRGKRLFLERQEELTCARRPQGWKIAAAKVEREKSYETAGPQFTEESAQRGLVFKHESSGVKDRWGEMMNYTPGSGLAAGDYDGDGWEDLFMAGGKVCLLFRNQGNGSFVEVTRGAGAVVAPFGEARCAAFADYDNDGHLDLFIGMLDTPDYLFHNNGDGIFSERTRQAGLRSTGETTGAAFADFNGDGFLDLYVLNGGNLLRWDPEPIYNALNATPNQLYLSNGDGTFTDRTRESGTGHGGWALALATQDYDLDGDVDIFIGNDFGFDVLYRNRGDGTFEEVSRSCGIDLRGASMSASWGDYDNDGAPDLFVGGMASNSRWITGHPNFPAPAPWYVNVVLRGTVIGIFQEMLHGNRLYHNRGDGTFEEISLAAGVRNNGWAWSSIFFDYDNDGLLDVYGVNGFLSGQIPRDL